MRCPEIEAATVFSADPKPLFDTDRRLVIDHRRHAIERRKRLHRTGVDERQIRAIRSRSRGETNRGVALVDGLGAGVGAREAVAAWIGNRRHRHIESRERPICRVRRVPTCERITRNRIEVASEPAEPCRIGRIGRAPDVGALEVRAAGVLIPGALDDGQAPLVEDVEAP